MPYEQISPLFVLGRTYLIKHLDELEANVDHHWFMVPAFVLENLKRHTVDPTQLFAQREAMRFITGKSVPDLEVGESGITIGATATQGQSDTRQRGSKGSMHMGDNQDIVLFVRCAKALHDRLSLIEYQVVLLTTNSQVSDYIREEKLDVDLVIAPSVKQYFHDPMLR